MLKCNREKTARTEWSLEIKILFNTITMKQHKFNFEIKFYISPINVFNVEITSKISRFLWCTSNDLREVYVTQIDYSTFRDVRKLVRCVLRSHNNNNNMPLQPI